MPHKEQPSHDAVPDPMRNVHSDAGADGAEMPIDEHGRALAEEDGEKDVVTSDED
jgi:hypothetical protein